MALSPRPVDLVVHAATVITVDGDRRVIDDGGVAVHAGRIVAVGPRREIEGGFSPRRRVAAPNGVLLPGLVDAHSHAGHGLIRTMGDDLDAWMDTCARVYLHGATPDFWRAEARLVGLERLLAGVTTSLSMLGGAGDTVRADDPAHGEAHLEAMASLGLRTVLVVGLGAPPFPKTTTRHDATGQVAVASTLEDQLATVAALEERWRGDDRGHVATTFPTLEPASVEAGGAELLAAADRVREIADERGLRIVQDGHRGDTVLATQRLGLLGPRTLLSHAVDLEARHIDAIALAHAAVAHNPAAIFSQWGRCPVPELMAAGVTVGLGSDATAPDRSADLFRHMFQLTRYHRADRRDPAWFPPGTAIEMATIGSATALGLDADVGSLEPGKAADMIVVRTDRPHLTPFTHPIHQLVYYATGADVDTVVVGGEVLVQDGHAIGVDTGEVLDAARREQAAAFARVDLEAPVSRPGLWSSARYGD